MPKAVSQMLATLLKQHRQLVETTNALLARAQNNVERSREIMTRSYEIAEALSTTDDHWMQRIRLEQLRAEMHKPH